MNSYVEKLKKDLSYKESFDVTFREIRTKYHHYTIIFLNFLIKSEGIINIIYSLDHFSSYEGVEQISKIILNESTTTENNYYLIYDAILSGNVAIFVDDDTNAILSEVRNYPTRGIEEPDGEKVVRGSRDGFTENIATNIGLIRRRVKSGKLKTIKYTIGKISKTNVALVYIEGYVQPKYLEQIKKRLDDVEVEELTMSDKALEELLIKNVYTPYPLVKYTERPDTFASHLYQGMFGIIVDTSPSAILGPISIFDHMQHAEEFRQTLNSGSYLRFIRFIGIILSFLAVPIWFTMLQYESLHFSYLGKIFDVENNHLAIFIQLLIMELGIEFIRMASIHTPDALSTSMGIIAGVIVGEMAINMNILSEQIVLLGAISAIGSYITPSYELSLANKIAKLIIIFVVFCFGVYGLIFSLIALLIYLSFLKSFGRPYLYPLIPFNFKALLNQLFRKPYKKRKHQ